MDHGGTECHQVKRSPSQIPWIFTDLKRQRCENERPAEREGSEALQAGYMPWDECERQFFSFEEMDKYSCPFDHDELLKGHMQMSRDLAEFELGKNVFVNGKEVFGGPSARDWNECHARYTDLKRQQCENERPAEREGSEAWQAGYMPWDEYEGPLFSFEESGIDVSQGEMAKHSCPLDHDERRKGHTQMSRLGGFFLEEHLHELHRPDRSQPGDIEMFSILYNSRRHEYAKIALEFYEKSQDAEFEMIEALYSDCSLLVVPGAISEHSGLPDWYQCWCHVSFIAKPKNADCSDASPKYFFAELLKDKGKFNAKYCSTFEPCDDPGYNHGCVICPADQKFHPGPGGYHIGSPPCYAMRGSFY